MKINAISDLHLEHWERHTKIGVYTILNEIDAPADVLVLAGDICAPNAHQISIESVLLHLANKHLWKDIVFVLGNHDSYHSSTMNEIIRLRQFAATQQPVHGSNIHFLENDIITINNITFAGCTLWFQADPFSQLWEKRLNDFSYIKDSKTLYQQGEYSAQWLEKIKLDVDVVVTHHMPSPWCINHHYKSDQLNRFFVNDCDKIIDHGLIKAWIYGHTHTRRRDKSKLYDTTMVCNPVGYPFESNQLSNINFVFQV